ncbi:class I SAM-dependent methyltransferase [Saccharopolyspora taberi]|uniref:Class I SAM-dependent methyltransferase n=1 Tax=Saccharopolyspora taberi TaxID=60895 RepID=A0ABN3VGY9_9PSEU
MHDDSPVALSDIDFDQVYAGGEAFAGMRFERVPWDFGGPQPAVVELEAAGEISGAVLDAGCGLGENALFLAARGYHVTGVDAASGAVEQARARAAERGLDAEFAVADATRLDGFESRFDTVVDSALYHCLDSVQRTAYSAALHRATAPGARLHLVCFSDAIPGTLPVTKDDLRAHLGGHWNIDRIDETRYSTAFTRELLRRQRAESDLDRLGVTFDPDALDVDERDRVLIPAWRLRAVRA